MIIAQIIEKLNDIICNPHALAFFSYFFENSSKKERKPLTERIIEISHYLVTNKQAILVVLKLGDKGSSIELKKLIKNLFSPENLKFLINSQLGVYALSYFLMRMSDKVKGEVISLFDKPEGFDRVKVRIEEATANSFLNV